MRKLSTRVSRRSIDIDIKYRSSRGVQEYAEPISYIVNYKKQNGEQKTNLTHSNQRHSLNNRDI